MARIFPRNPAYEAAERKFNPLTILEEIANQPTEMELDCLCKVVASAVALGRARGSAYDIIKIMAYPRHLRLAMNGHSDTPSNNGTPPTPPKPKNGKNGKKSKKEALLATIVEAVAQMGED